MLQRLRDRERFDRPGRLVPVPRELQQPAVEQHPHGLDRVEGDPLCALDDPRPQLFREAGREAVEELLDLVRRERVEEERGEVATSRAPGRAPLGQLRARERQDEDRVGARPVEQILDEVEQPVVGPLQVLEQEDDRLARRHPLEEDPPGGEEILFVRCAPLGDAEEMREAGLEEAPLLGVLNDADEGLAQPRARRLGVVLLGDPRAHPHHLRERPVRDSVAVGEAAPAVPAHVVCEPVDVLLELPGETRLAGARGADDRDEPRATLLRGRVEEILDQPELRRPADERRLEAAARPSPRRAAITRSAR